VLKILRNKAFTKILWGFMSLYLLNISVDTADARIHRVAEDLSINDQESIIEIVVEKVFGYENAIKEYDDNDFEKYGKSSNIKMELFKQHIVDYDLKPAEFKFKKHQFWNRETFLRNGHIKPDLQPPKFRYSYS
jgi:hypothetical protein